MSKTKIFINLSLISPEVGVTIFEGDKQKTGGKDYLKHFKKYSKYDYTQLIVYLN